MGVAAACFGWKLPDTNALLAAAALLAGILVAVFVQLATWRERIRSPQSTIPKARLDEAVALCLLTAVVCVGLTVALAVLSNLPHQMVLYRWDVSDVAPRLLTGIAIAACANVVSSFLVIANLLWDAYSFANRPEPKQFRS